MQLVQLDGVALEYDVVGSGEPLLLIHGGFIAAESYLPLVASPSIASGCRTISYNRRGYAGSSSATAPLSIGQQAADARALLEHLGIPRAHVAGHSYGGAIALQLALDAPDLVGSLALLEPALVSAIPSASEFQEQIGTITSLHRGGDREGATDAFCTVVLGPDYRKLLQKHLPPGALERTVAASDIVFGVEAPALQEWNITADDAARIRQPVLSVIGEESGPMFEEVHKLVQQWIPHAEELRAPQANHGLQYVNPRPIADGLAHFVGRNPL